MNDSDAHLSREVTAALNVSMPRTVSVAGQARLGSTMILVGAFGVVPLGLLSVIFAAAIAQSPALVVVTVAAYAVLIAVEVTGGVIGLRAKGAVKQIRETVEQQYRATLVRVVNGEVQVRR